MLLLLLLHPLCLTLTRQPPEVGKKPSASPYAPPVSFSAIKEDAGGGAAAPRVPPKNRVVAPAGRDIVCLLLLCVRVFCSLCVYDSTTLHAMRTTGLAPCCHKVAASNMMRRRRRVVDDVHSTRL